MRTKLTIENPDQIEATLTITMKVKDWRELQAQLSREWPAWRLSSEITDLLRQVQRAYFPTPPPHEERDDG